MEVNEAAACCGTGEGRRGRWPAEVGDGRIQAPKMQVWRGARETGVAAADGEGAPRRPWRGAPVGKKRGREVSRQRRKTEEGEGSGERGAQLLLLAAG